MTTSITRRSFIKKSSSIGTVSILGTGLLPGFLYCKSPAATPICRVKREIYVPSPKPRVGTSVSMTYIGRKLRREEVRSLMRSSDWSDTVRRRTSDDNGRTWSDWELVYKEAPTQGAFRADA